MDRIELLNDFVKKAGEHLQAVENFLVPVQGVGTELSGELLNKTLRAIQSVHGAAESLGLIQINPVSHRLERVLDKAQAKEVLIDPQNLQVILQAVRRLTSLIESIKTGGEIDCSEVCQRLDAILKPKTPKTRNSAGRRRPPAPHVNPNSNVLPSGATSDEVIRRVEDRLDEADVTLLSAGNPMGSDTVAD